MKSFFVTAALGAGLLLCAGAYAQAPAGATAQCKDGTYFSGTTHKGACRGHKGVKHWLNASASGAAPAADTAKAAAPTKARKSHKSKKSKTEEAAPAAASTASSSAAAPAGATAQCKDGTYFSGTTHKGACRGHKGVKHWLSASATPAAASTAAATPAPATAPAAPATHATKAKSTHHAPTPASQIAQKPGGGPGLVWVNASSKVYHCQSDPWYGKTKEGSYMTEAAAKAAGNHGSHGKDCSN